MPARMHDPRLLRSLPRDARVQIRPYSIAQLTACAIVSRISLCKSPARNKLQVINKQNVFFCWYLAMVTFEGAGTLPTTTLPAGGAGLRGWVGAGWSCQKINI
jgi:hypothetical protein